MKKKYQKPALDLENMLTADVLTASGMNPFEARANGVSGESMIDFSNIFG